MLPSSPCRVPSREGDERDEALRPQPRVLGHSEPHGQRCARLVEDGARRHRDAPITAGVAPAQIRCPPAVVDCRPGGKRTHRAAQPVEVVQALPVLVGSPTRARVGAWVVPARCSIGRTGVTRRWWVPAVGHLASSERVHAKPVLSTLDVENASLWGRAPCRHRAPHRDCLRLTICSRRRRAPSGAERHTRRRQETHGAAQRSMLCGC